MTDPMMQNFYGTATVGERGQVVIPQSAREAMGLKPGEKLLVVGGPFGKHGVAMVRAEAFSDFLAKMTARFSEMEKMLETQREL